MMNDPIPNMSAEDFRIFWANNCTTMSLADIYAVVHNKFWFVEDDEYDYETGSSEHKKACSITDAWGELMDECKKQIFDILISEGATIPDSGQFKVLELYMQKFGYSNCNGWWVKM